MTETGNKTANTGSIDGKSESAESKAGESKSANLNVPPSSANRGDELRLGTTPNILTMSRIALVPVVVILLTREIPSWNLAAALIFGAASITDYFDGYLARVQKSVSIFGKLMDPLADKFLVVSALIMLQAIDRIHPVMNILLICRELAITGLRALASAEGVVISASSGGKWKTATQMVAIPFIMAKEGLFGLPLYPIGHVLLFISLGISLYSALDYVVDFFRAFREKIRYGKRRT